MEGLASIHMGVSQVYGVPFLGGPYNKDDVYWGPYLGKLHIAGNYHIAGAPNPKP